MNNSSAVPSPGLSPCLIALRTSFITFIGLLMIFGNLLSIAVTRRVSNLADSTKVLMTSLAVSDLLVGAMTLFTVVTSALDRWPFGDVACTLAAVWAFSSVVLSVFSIIFLNVERYIAVSRPYRFLVLCSRRRVTILVLVTSTLILCTAVIVQSELPSKYYTASAICFFGNSSTVISTLTLLMFVIFPMTTMTCVYCRMIKISRQHEKRVNHIGNKANHLQDNKALKTFLVVTLTFALCFTPIMLYKALDSYIGMGIPPWLHFIMSWLAYSNSAFNVFIYCLFNRSYRQTAKEIISKILSCRRKPVVPVDVNI